MSFYLYMRQDPRECCDHEGIVGTGARLVNLRCADERTAHFAAMGALGEVNARHPDEPRSDRYDDGPTIVQCIILADCEMREFVNGRQMGAEALKEYFEHRAVQRKADVEAARETRIRELEAEIAALKSEPRQPRTMGGATVINHDDVARQLIDDLERQSACPCGSGRDFSECHGKETP